MATCQWVQNLVDRYPERLTGWLTLDWMCEQEAGQLYPIECKPWVDSNIMLYKPCDGIIDSLTKFLFDDDANNNNTNVYFTPKGYISGEVKNTILRPSKREVYFCMDELWTVLCNITKFDVIKERVGKVIWNQEGVFQFQDPLPFIMLNFIQIPYFMLQCIVKGKAWKEARFSEGILK